jgi:16S rRNA C967 or C1407 C5-methylase (RsmB/RsmF family)
MRFECKESQVFFELKFTFISISMGKRKSKKENKWKPAVKDYPETVLENEKLEQYYKEQQILEEEEFAQFMESLKTPLPVAFRITGSRKHAVQLREYMKKKLFPTLTNLEVDGEIIPPPMPIPWYPDEFAWVYECGRTALRRSKEAAMFHRFLVSENEVGNISRQEAVSMLPVLFMDVKPGQYILDMCAAPGSKTAQLLENLIDEKQDFPDGLVVANDSDQKRAYLLVHQAKRLQTPCLLVTNHDGQDFPKIVIEQAIDFDFRMVFLKGCNLIEYYAMYLVLVTEQFEKTRLYGTRGSLRAGMGCIGFFV